MKPDAITIRRNAARDDITITVANRTSIVQCSGMTRDERATLVTELWHWKRGGFRGFPTILQ